MNTSTNHNRSNLTPREAIKRAVEQNDVVLAGRVALHLRFQYRMPYAAVADLFLKVAGVPLSQFETMMQESEAQPS